MATFAAVETDTATAIGGTPARLNPTFTTSTFDSAHQDALQSESVLESSTSTPTRQAIAGMLAQRPLPNDPLSLSAAMRPTSPAIESTPSPNEETLTSRLNGVPQASDDVEMGEGDDDDMAEEEDGSDNESIASDSQRPSKKKKGQRFFCTEYPPCQLSFTRSEHLARHIRKHTGERPFQCHCSRRFSRLDNLRQHAQTVHVNEDIPGDSLAATSTRFQRQIRTDRIRPPGSSRSRTGTFGSQGGHSRGHSRNLSASSVASTVSTMSISEDVRRRPQPLAMAGDNGTRLRPTSEVYEAGHPSSSQGPPPYGYYSQGPPSGFATPTANHFSQNNISPQRPPEMATPSSAVSRSSTYHEAVSHSRRLSVPSSPNPYQPQPTSYAPPYYSPTSSTTFSPNASTFASPTSSVFSHNRRESESEMDYRRRTWHASTNPHLVARPATSGLTYHQTPDQPRPAFSQQPAASQMTRLPGIESFDHAPPPGPPPPRQYPSPMMAENAPRPTSSGRLLESSGLNQGLTRLDITAANAATENHWHSSHYQQPPQTQSQPPYRHAHHLSMPEQTVTPRRLKRNAWYGGPVSSSLTVNALPISHRPSPEDSGSSEGVQTPSMSITHEHHPIIYNSTSNSNGDHYPPAPAVTGDERKVYQVAYEQKPEPSRADSGFQSYPHDAHAPHAYALQNNRDPRFALPDPRSASDNTRLDALVTAALGTSPNTTAAQH